MRSRRKRQDEEGDRDPDDEMNGGYGQGASPEDVEKQRARSKEMMALSEVGLVATLPQSYCRPTRLGLGSCSFFATQIAVFRTGSTTGEGTLAGS